MAYDVRFAPKALKTIGKWKKSDPTLFKKLSTILHELIDHPRTGRGHPEPLVGGGGITYSRRITASDRIIYDIYDSEVVVLVISLEGHYDDK